MNQRKPLQLAKNCATITPEQPEMIYVTRDEAEKEHSLLIARLHHLRDLLGYPPLQTGKETRRAHPK